jgi:hypothetical protein
MSKNAFKIVVSQEDGDWQRLAFAGAINEDAKAALMAHADTAGKKCILDLGDVTLINSCGIRDWSIFLRALKAEREVVFDRCTDEIVRTMNMVTNFYYRLPVRSVYRAYGCENCGHEQVEHLKEGKDFAAGAVPHNAPVKCNSCGQATEAFEPDDEFFQFLVSA